MGWENSPFSIFLSNRQLGQLNQARSSRRMPWRRFPCRYRILKPGPTQGSASATVLGKKPEQALFLPNRFALARLKNVEPTGPVESGTAKGPNKEVPCQNGISPIY